MSSPKAYVQGLVGRVLFRDAVVTRAEALGARFRRIVLAGAELKGVSWTPGDKLQLFFPSVGTRAYTPVRWDAGAGETELLVYVHGDAPGTRWARDVLPGARIQIFGPRASLDARGTPPAVIVGDETSIGLVLARGSADRTVLEVTDAAETRAVLESVGLGTSSVLVQRRPGDGQLTEFVEAVVAALQGTPGARLLLSGRAAAIQAVRQGLKARGVVPAEVKTKAYWAPGKTGLD